MALNNITEGVETSSCFKFEEGPGFKFEEGPVTQLGEITFRDIIKEIWPLSI